MSDNICKCKLDNEIHDMFGNVVRSKVCLPSKPDHTHKMDRYVPDTPSRSSGEMTMCGDSIDIVTDLIKEKTNGRFKSLEASIITNKIEHPLPDGVIVCPSNTRMIIKEGELIETITANVRVHTDMDMKHCMETCDLSKKELKTLINEHSNHFMELEKRMLEIYACVHQHHNQMLERTTPM